MPIFYQIGVEGIPFTGAERRRTFSEAHMDATGHIRRTNERAEVIRITTRTEAVLGRASGGRIDTRTTE